MWAPNIETVLRKLFAWYIDTILFAQLNEIHDISLWQVGVLTTLPGLRHGSRFSVIHAPGWDTQKAYVYVLSDADRWSGQHIQVLAIDSPFFPPRWTMYSCSLFTKTFSTFVGKWLFVCIYTPTIHTILRIDVWLSAHSQTTRSREILLLRVLLGIFKGTKDKLIIQRKYSIAKPSFWL